MGNDVSIHQDFPDDSITDSESRHQSSIPSTSVDRGYVSEAPSSRRRRHNRKHVTTHREDVQLQPAASSSTDNVTKQVNWWNKFNRGALRKDSYDYLFLMKNSRFIQDMLEDFSDMTTMINENFNQIDATDPEERSNRFEPNALHLFDNLAKLCIDDVMTMTYKQASAMQKTISYQYISQMAHRAMETVPTETTKKYTVLEIVSFYYDFFYISLATFVKCNVYKTDSSYNEFPHSAFKILFPQDVTTQKENRTRMNSSEILGSGMYIDMCMMLKNKYVIDSSTEPFLIEMIIPSWYFKDTTTIPPPKSREDEMNAVSMANVLHLFGYHEHMNTTGMRVVTIDANLVDSIGEDAYVIVNKLLLFNIECIIKMLEKCDGIWSKVVSKWMQTYGTTVIHSPTNAMAIPKDTFDNPVALYRDMTDFNYSVKLPYDQWIHRFYVGSAIKVDDVFFSMAHNTPLTKKDAIGKTDLMASRMYMFRKDRIPPEKFAMLVQHMMLVAHALKGKGYISSFVSMTGMLGLHAKNEQKQEYTVTLYREIKPSLLSLISMNFRFFPIFDMMVTLARGEEDMRNVKCHLNFEYMSALFSINNIKYDSQEKRIIINFPISINQIKQTILHHGNHSMRGKRMVTSQESIFIPLNWVDDSNVPAFAREVIQRDYRIAKEFVINKLRIASFTNNDVLKGSCVVISTAQPIERMTATYASIKDNRMASSNTMISIVQGAGVVFKNPIVTELAVDAKEHIIYNINDQEKLSSESIVGIHKCEPMKAKVRLNNFSTFIQPDTHIECIQSFNISLVLDVDSVSSMIEQWMSLYFHWPLATSKAIGYHTSPGFIL